jgi:hypothetical protein
VESWVKSANDRAELPRGFLPRLEIPQITRDSHLSPASTTDGTFNLKLNNRNQEKSLDSAAPFIDAPAAAVQTAAQTLEPPGHAEDARRVCVH